MARHTGGLRESGNNLRERPSTATANSTTQARDRRGWKGRGGSSTSSATNGRSGYHGHQRGLEISPISRHPASPRRRHCIRAAALLRRCGLPNRLDALGTQTGANGQMNDKVVRHGFAHSTTELPELGFFVTTGPTARMLLTCHGTDAEHLTPRLCTVHVDQSSVQLVNACERQLQTQRAVQRQIRERLLHVCTCVEYLVSTQHGSKLSARTHGQR